MVSNSPRFLSWEDFDSLWRVVHGRVFSGRDPASGPFRDKTWSKLLLPCGLQLTAATLKAFRDACLPHGDAFAVVLDPERQFPEQRPVIARWEQSDFAWLANETVLGHIDVHVFGGSAAWGVVLSHDQFGMFGGAPDVVSVFTESIGGLPKLKAEFREHVAQGNLGLGRDATNYAHSLQVAVGWI